jgi:hypothetical protein
MGEKSESLCRQTPILLGQNTEFIPPLYDLAEAQRDLAVLDLLRPRFSRLRLLMSRADDTEMALGRDLLSAALEGYAIAKAFGKGAGLDALKEAMATRFSGKRRAAKPGAQRNGGEPDALPRRVDRWQTTRVRNSQPRSLADCEAGC